MSIEHRPELGRFETEIEGHTSLIEYRLGDGVLTITHTEVAPELEGRGIGGTLVKAVLDHAEAEHLKVDPVCSYARAYMQRHGDATAPRV